MAKYSNSAVDIVLMSNVKPKFYVGTNWYVIQKKYLHTMLKFISKQIGLDRTGHMSFPTGQDRTPKFAGKVLPDQIESGLIFLNILLTKYGLSILIR